MELEPASIAAVKKGRGGNLVLVEDDVCDIVRQVRDLHPDFRVKYNERGEYFVIYQMVEGRERLVATTNELDSRVIDRLRKITHPDYDYGKEMDRIDAEADKAKDHTFKEKMGEMGEALYHAVRKDKQTTDSITVPRDLI